MATLEIQNAGEVLARITDAPSINSFRDRSGEGRASPFADGKHRATREGGTGRTIQALLC